MHAADVELSPMSGDGRGFSVFPGDAMMAGWVVAPEVPWVFVEAFEPLRNGDWHTEPVRLRPARAVAPRARRVRNLRMDLLFRTPEFLEALPDLAHADNGGLILWQMDKEPSGGLSLHELCYGKTLSSNMLDDALRNTGTRLHAILQCRGEFLAVTGLDPADVEQAWNRVSAKLKP